MIRDPSNWQEMQTAIVKELRNKAAELQERAEAVEKLANTFGYIENWSVTPTEYDEADYHGDLEHLKLLNEMLFNWPWIATAPGEGYW